MKRMSGVVAVVVASAGVATIAAVAPASAVAPANVRVPAGATVSVGVGYSGQHHGQAVVRQWASAWNNNRPAQMAGLFTADGTYSDFAFGAVWHGKKEIANWVSLTHAAIKDTHLEVTSSFRSGNQIAIQWVFSGVMPGATKPFAVPATTIIKLRGERIVSNADYYNLADLLRQSGLPADWHPPTS